MLALALLAIVPKHSLAQDPAPSSDPDVTVYKNDYQLVIRVSLELG